MARGCRAAAWITALPFALSMWALSCGRGVDSAPTDLAAGMAGGEGVGGEGQGPESGGAAGASPAGPKADRDTHRDILSTHLELDLAARSGVATIELVGSLTSNAATFEIGDLSITSIEGDEGPLDYELAMGRRGSLLDVAVPMSADATKLVISYTFTSHSMLDGWNAWTRNSFLFPYFCGNLFPCRSEPADGVKFSMDVSGYAANHTALFPESLTIEAPSYMLGITVGPLTELELGVTTNGTQLSVWPLPGTSSRDFAGGTAHLLEVFDFYEQTYGDYAFGAKAGSVAVDWGTSGFGGMEHHP